ncbi:MAG: type II secretion system protein [Planctomycetes bacterium]|nr:type II secretion system protein [Planctomycetota bacterium]
MSRRYGPNKDGGAIAQPCGINRRRTARRSPAFTLIELVVVISIILLLVGLTMSVGLAVRSQSETRQTENVLILLDQAVKQWQIAADRQLSWGINDTPMVGAVYDVQGHIDESNSPSPGEQLEDLLRRISTNQSARDILAQIDNDFLQQETEDNVTFLTLVDPWGSPVCLIHPGRLPDLINYPNDFVGDIDGTIRTDHENQFGIALNRALLFLSAGPDGEFGDLEAQTDSPEFQATQDNVYSYKPGSGQ